MDDKDAFDPNEPFDVVHQPKDSSGFNPSDDFEVVKDASKPHGLVEGALSPVTSYPEAYKKERDASAGMIANGLKRALHPVEGGNAFGDLGRAATGLGQAGLGALGYLYSPISAAQDAFVDKPVTNLTGSPTVGKIASIASGLAIPGAGLTKLPMKAIPEVAPTIHGAAETADTAMEIAKRNAAKAKEFTDSEGRPMELSHGEATQNPTIWRDEDTAYRGGHGKEAQEAIGPIRDERFKVMHGAAEKIGDDLGGNRGSLTPNDSSDILANEIQENANRASTAHEALVRNAENDTRGRITALADQQQQLGYDVRGNNAPIADQNEAGEIVGQSIRDRAAQARTSVNEAYTQAHALPGEFHAGAFEGIGQRIKGELSNVSEAGRDPVIIDDITTPIASRAIQHLDNGISRLKIQNRADPFGQPNPENIVAVDLRGVDQARKQLVQFYKAARSGQNPADARAMAKVIDGFDNQVEQAVSNGLFSGDPGALEALQNARAAYRRYSQTYRPQNSMDDVGKAMRQIIDRNATPEETARMLVGSGVVGNSGLPVRLAQRMEQIFGRDSQEWSSVRQALWRNASRTTNAQGIIDPIKSAGNIERLANSTLGRQVFEPEELNAFRNHARAIRDLESNVATMPSRQAVKRSASDYERLFGGGDTDVGQNKLMRDIISGTAKTDQITNGVFNAIHSKNPANAAKFIDSVERITGTGSPAMQAIRQGVWQRLVGKAEGADKLGAQKLSQDIFNFLDKAVSKQMYSPEELAHMRRFAEVVRLKAPTAASKTNSDTVPALGAMIRGLLSHKIATAGATAGHAVLGFPGSLIGAAVGHSVDRVLANVSNKRMAEKALKSYTGWDRASGGRVPGRDEGGDVPTPVAAPDQSNNPDYDPALEAEIARHVAASRIKSAVAPESGRQEGLATDIITKAPGVLVKHAIETAKSAATAPLDAFTGKMQVSDPETGMPTPEAMGRASEIAGMAMTTGMPMAERGALGMFGGMPTYSAAGEAVQNAKAQVMHPSQWLGYLKNQPGVKPAELEHVGLEDWLKDQKGPISKDQVNEYIQSKQPEIQEVRKGNIDDPLVKYFKESFGPAISNIKTPEDIADARKFNSAFRETTKGLSDEEVLSAARKAENVHDLGDTKYESYQLPGGTNYGETLLTLPNPVPAIEQRRQHLLEIANAWPAHQDRDAAIAELQALNQQHPASARTGRTEGYQSSHWDEPNVLLHMRHNDREIPGTGFSVQNSVSGNKSQVFKTREEAQAYQDGLPKSLKTNVVETPTSTNSLHLEELQSDSHQTGRKNGYKTLETQAKFDRLNSEYNGLQKSTADLMAEIRQKVGLPSGEEAIANRLSHEDRVALVDARLKAYNADPRYQKALADMARVEREKHEVGSTLASGVPDFPFKTTWPDLGLKRMLHRAATEKNPDGSYKYDSLSWTPGEAQAARYDLSKQVDAIRVNKNPDGTYQVGIQPIGRNMQRYDESIPAEKLSDHIGKDLAEKAVKEVTESGVDKGKVFSGVDLKVGGHGMRQFYDKMLVDKANSLTKKYGTKVKYNQDITGGRTNESVSGSDVMNHMGMPEDQHRDYWRNLTQQQRDQHFDDYRGRHGTKIKAHVLPITPELRKAAEKGFPTFAQGGRVTSAAITRRESEYSPTRGTPEHHCGPVKGWKHDCAFFVKGGTCTKVGGSIAPKGGCNWFSDKVANRADGGGVDDETANAYRYWFNEDPEAPPPTALARKGVYVKTGDLAEGPSTNIEDRSQEPPHAPEMTKKEWAQANVYGNQLFDRDMLDEMSSDPVTRYRMRESLGYNDINKFNKHRADGWWANELQ